jgi:EAL domain-containing protein (putative c-di-GMP-specific phosphodiesterase class I)
VGRNFAGTGYPSLSFLRSFPFTRIKLDQSLMRGLVHDPQSDAIVRAVTGLCDSLGVAATAEGVETEQQRDILRRQNCTALQGYFISRPQPAHALPAMIRAQAAA